VDFPATHALGGRACLDGEAGASSSLIGDSFVAKYSSNGARVFATCLGGIERDAGRAVAIAADGTIHVGGFSRSDGFPITPGAFQDTRHGGYDTTLSRLDANATAVLASTWIGGTASDFIQQARVLEDGSVVVVGTTESADFPVTPGAFQTSFAGPAFGGDAILARIAADASSLVFATYLGGSGAETTFGLEVDDAGRIYVGGTTASPDFPQRMPVQGRGALSSLAGDLGPNDDTRALAAGFVVDEDFAFHDVVAAGNEGVDRVYLFDQAHQLEATFDLGAGSDGTRAIALYDRNGDGSLDLDGDGIVVGNDDAPSRFYRYDGDAFLPGIDLGPDVRPTRAVVTGQVRGDFLSDLVVGNFREPNLYHPAAAGGFGAGVAAFPGSAQTATTSLALGDLDGDGRIDVIEGNEAQTNRVYFGTNTGFAAGVAIGAESDATTAIAVADLDADFDPDVIAGNADAPNRFYRNRGDGTFDPATDLDPAPATTTALVVWDLEPDGDPDIITSDAGGGCAYVNTGDGSFTREPLVAAAEPARAIAATPGTFAYRATGPEAPIRTMILGSDDGFVAILASTGDRLINATYVGGGGDDFSSWAIDPGPGGNVYYAGGSAASDFPVLAPLQAQNAGGTDGFVWKAGFDADVDGPLDGEDNCIETANADQRDTNGDGFGNACDPDLDDNGIVNFVDLGIMRSVFFQVDDDADLNGDGRVNFGDLAVLKQYFFQPPGPSGIGPEAPR
jgi:hypothetical protein